MHKTWITFAALENLFLMINKKYYVMNEMFPNYW